MDNQAESSPESSIAAMQLYVRIEDGSLCHVETSSYFKNLVNNHPSKAAWAKIRINYTDDFGRLREEFRLYDIGPSVKIELGCPVPGPTLQRFEYSIAESRWTS